MTPLRRIAVCSVVALSVLALGRPAGAAPASAYELQAQQSRLHFEVHATLHDVHGRAHEAAGRVVYDPATGQVRLPARIDIPVRSLETGNAARDREMAAMFESGKFPVIRWEAQALACEPLSGQGEGRCEAQGTLRIRTITRPIAFHVQLKRDGDQLRASGAATIPLDEFDLHPPSFLGVMRVGKEVTFAFETVWRPADS